MKSTVTLEQFEPFASMSETGRSQLGRGLHYNHVTDRVTILNKGQRVSGAYVVVEGGLRVYTLSPSGSEATLYLIRPGETCVLALNCIFNDLLYPAWVEALPNTRVAVIPGLLYRSLFESETGVRNLTVQAFSTIVFRLMSELEEIHSFNLEQRLANFLLLHASNEGRVRMTQQLIASHLGTTREVIARVLSGLAAGGFITTGRNLIEIRDPIRLAARRFR